ncbi:hypothetical protein [Dietzia sp.]|uniref:hypothetical protein n=1 Tax=Dietzia sp. TaxID=1871616 RepID=UPI002FD9D7F2
MTVTKTASTRSATTTKAKPKVTTTVPAAGAASAAGSSQVSDKEFVHCIFGGGNWTENAIFSDGSFGPDPLCKQLREDVLRERPFRCPGTDAQVADLSSCTNRSTPSRPSPERQAPPTQNNEPSVPTSEPQIETSAAEEPPTSAAASAGGDTVEGAAAGGAAAGGAGE